MTGACLVVRADERPARHTHLVLGFADGRALHFVDPRRFGGLHVGDLRGLADWGPLRELGPEPFSAAFTGTRLEQRLARSDRTLRDVLLDQTIVAGVGNIYVSEALFQARLHPLIEARRLRSTAWDRLVAATLGVLRVAVSNGGTTLRDYRTVNGESGANAAALWVYGRAGEPCRRCGARLRGYVHQGRSGVLCPVEQRWPRTKTIE
jgi:formamidopyrimidine-DNA glycosylase